MGCDIHLITEIRKNGKWEYVEDIPTSLDKRNYHTFAMLAGVRDYFNIGGFEPKGLPSDLSSMKFRFDSEMPHIIKRYNEDSCVCYIDADGTVKDTSEAHKKEISQMEYDEFCKLSDKQDENYFHQYHSLCKQYVNNETSYTVRDAYLTGGHFSNIPFKEQYKSLEEFAQSIYDDEWDEDAKDYGYWRVNFDYVADGDYHTPSYLSLQELVEKDYMEYTSHRYKMDRSFYDAFIQNGGTFPDNFRVVGDTKAGDVAEIIREAFNPTVLIAWQMPSEEQNDTPLFKGIEELKEIAKKYDITNYEDIRIVFAFDN